MPETSVVTLARHIVEEERRHPEATGAFTNILMDIALAAKVISREVSKAGLVDVLGRTGDTNVHGESVQKLDVFADAVIFNAMDHTGNLCCMASEEHPDVLDIPERFPTGDYALLFDPLDGSSNIDVNVSIGTIFSVHRKISSRRARLSGGLPPARPAPARRRLCRLRVLYDARLHQRRRRARLHAGPLHRRVPPEPPRSSAFPSPRP